MGSGGKKLWFTVRSFSSHDGEMAGDRQMLHWPVYKLHNDILLHIICIIILSSLTSEHQWVTECSVVTCYCVLPYLPAVKFGWGAAVAAWQGGDLLWHGRTALLWAHGAAYSWIIPRLGEEGQRTGSWEETQGITGASSKKAFRGLAPVSLQNALGYLGWLVFHVVEAAQKKSQH